MLFSFLSPLSRLCSLCGHSDLHGLCLACNTMVKRGKYNKKDKTYTWTAKITTKASDVGTKTIEVVAYDEDGVASEAETVKVTVTAKPAKGGKK